MICTFQTRLRQCILIAEPLQFVDQESTQTTAYPRLKNPIKKLVENAESDKKYSGQILEQTYTKFSKGRFYVEDISVQHRACAYVKVIMEQVMDHIGVYQIEQFDIQFTLYKSYFTWEEEEDYGKNNLIVRLCASHWPLISTTHLQCS